MCCLLLKRQIHIHLREGLLASSNVAWLSIWKESPKLNTMDLYTSLKYLYFLFFYFLSLCRHDLILVISVHLLSMLPIRSSNSNVIYWLTLLTYSLHSWLFLTAPLSSETYLQVYIQLYTVRISFFRSLWNQTINPVHNIF